MKERTKEFALRIFKLADALPRTRTGNTIATSFWLEMIVAAKLQKSTRIVPLLQEADELTAIAVATRKTASSRR